MRQVEAASLEIEVPLRCEGLLMRLVEGLAESG
jgi:hypothetical protein